MLMPLVPLATQSVGGSTVGDPRYKSGTSLTKTVKEEWRDRLLDELPELSKFEFVLTLDKSLMKMDIDGLMTLTTLIRKLKRETTNAKAKETSTK